MNENLKKKDLDIILEVNKKAIEIETEVAGQNEEIIAFLETNAEQHKDIIAKLDNIFEQNEKIIEQNEKIDRSLFKFQVLVGTGVIGVIIQIVQMWIKN